MPLAAIALTCGSAIIHALWNVMLKRTKDLDTSSARGFAVALVV